VKYLSVTLFICGALLVYSVALGPGLIPPRAEPLFAESPPRWYLTIEENKKKEIEKRVEYETYGAMPKYNIPLPIEVQKHIWRLSRKHELSYELILAVISGESSFIVDNVGYNRRDGTVVSRDLGLMQLNTRYMDYFARKAGIKNFDPFDPYMNTSVGVFVLAQHRNFFRSYGLSEEAVFELMLSKYNTGGNFVFERYVEHIVRHKERIERGDH